MPTQLRYIGTTNPLFETAITGKPSMWRPGRTSDVPDADVPALLASGLFEVVDLRDRDTSVPISAALVSTPTADMLSIASRDVTYIAPDGNRYRSNATESAAGTALVAIGSAAGGSVQNALTPASSTSAPSVDAVVEALSTKVGYRAPMALTDADLVGGELVLTAEVHANRLLLCNFTAPVNAVLNNDATTGASNDDTFIIEQTNAAGFITGVAGSGTLSATPAYRVSTIGVGSVVQFQRKSANTYRPIEPLVPLLVQRKHLDFVTPLDTVLNTVTTFDLPPLLPTSRVEVMVTASGTAGAGNKTLNLELDAAGIFSGNVAFGSTAVNGTTMLGFFNQGATNSQRSLHGSNTNNSHFGTGANSANTKAVQTANPTTLSLKIQKATGTDALTIHMAELRVWL